MRPGDVVDQRFTIERLAAAGGMGVVYRALDAHTGAPVALKLLLGAPLHEDEVRFEREALALVELDHPGVVRHVAHGATAEGLRYLAMEWIDGEDLAARIRRAPLSADETVALCLRLSAALGAVHACGVVHRDLKPSNVLLAGDVLESAKIVDFGLATFPEAPRATMSGTVLGTPAYMAPEQTESAHDLDARADVFALGCILHECLTGKPAFEGGNVMAVLLKIVLEEVPHVRALGLDVPAALDRLIARMLSKDPARRPVDGNAVALALTGLEIAAEVGTGLGPTEQRLACFVVAQAPPDAGFDPRATTLVGAAPPREVRAALDAIEARGGRAMVLAVGTIAATTRGPGLATDHAALAAGCALALRSALRDWSIAVTTGRAEVGMDRPVGAAIDRAMQRISTRRSAAGVPPIDLDDVTAGLLDPRFDVASGPLGLELCGERDMAEAARTLLGRPTPFVGRDRDLAALEALFAECVEEPAARAALVIAPAGVGKSRLRREIVQRIVARGGVESWIARGEPARAGTPFGLIAPLIRRAAHLFDGEPAEAQRQKILARVSRNVAAPERLRVAEFLGELVGMRFPTEGRVELRAALQDPRLLGDQMLRAWVDFMDAETAAQPVVIALEDLHWSDGPSTEYLDAALRLLRDRPLMVLAFARPEVHDRLPRLWHERGAQQFRLHELSRRACERLAREVLGEHALPEIVARISERSAGNAFFLEELLRAAAEGRDGALPDTLLAMVESRFDALDLEDRRLLRAASLFGEVFWSGGLAALLTGASELDERLVHLEKAEWILARPAARFRGEQEYAFRHALVREAAYRMLLEEDRSLGHRLAGTWLEAVGEGDAAVLAEHYERGGDIGRAIHWHAAAAERASARHAYADAERLYGRVLEMLSEGSKAERCAAHRGRGRVRYPLGRYQDALADFACARALALEQGNEVAQIEILLDEAMTLDWMDDHKGSGERVEEARALLPETRPPLLEARLLLGGGRSAHRCSRNGEAAVLLERAAAAASSLGEDGYETLVIALTLLGFILPGLNRMDDAIQALDRTIALCESRGDRLHLTVAIGNRALVCGCLGDKDQMVGDMERSISGARALGHNTLELAGEYNLGELLLLMDDAPAAEPHVRRALALDRELSGEPGRAVVALLEARLHLCMGDEGAAQTIATHIRDRQAEMHARGEPDTLMAPSEDVLCTMIELATRDSDDDAWDALEARSDRISVGQERIEVLETRALAAQRRERVDDARRHLLRALDLAARIPNAMGARLRRRLAELAPG